MAITFKTAQSLINTGFNQLSGQTLTLSGCTIIGNSGKFSYYTDQHNYYTARSVTDAAYVTGLTSCIANIGLNQQIIYRDTLGITGATDFIYNKSLPSLVFGTNNNALSIDSAIIGGNNNFIASGNTGSTILGGNNVILSAATYCNTVVIPNLAIWHTPAGSGNILAWNNISKKVYLTSGSSVMWGSIGGVLSGQTDLQNVLNDKLNINNFNFYTGTTAPNTYLGINACAVDSARLNNYLSTYYLNTGSTALCATTAGNALCLGGKLAICYITGATNGLYTVGSNVLMGGALTICTVLNGACFDIQGVNGMNMRTTGNTDINIDAQSCGGFAIKSQCGICPTFTDFTDAVGILGHAHVANGFAIYDNRTTGQTGIVYAADYSLNYVNRSLVDKQYVDTIATGLNVHTAVRVATTSGITIATAPAVIDGITLVNGDRVLIKNQGVGVTGHTDNGIYDFNGAGNSLTRSADYDGSPASEVSNGDLIPVITGLTQNSSIWALTTLNPIIVGVTSLIFSEFSTIIDVIAGQGIAITQVGGTHTVCVDLASNCGLMFCGSQLAVNSNIAGSCLNYISGVLNVCSGCFLAVNGTAVSATTAGNALCLGGLSASVYQTKSGIVTYTGTTAPNTYLCKTNFNTYTGTTAPATFALKSSINTYTGTTAPATFALKSSINTYTGTTAPNTFLSITALISVNTGNTYSIQSSDCGKILEFTNTGSTSIFLPTGLTTGFQFDVTNVGGGNKTFCACTGANIYSLCSHVILAGAYNMAAIYQSSTNNWVLSGNLC